MFQNVVILSQFRLKLPFSTEEGSPAKTSGQEFQSQRGEIPPLIPNDGQAHRKTTSISSSWHQDLCEPFQFPESQNLKKPFHTYFVEYLYSTLNVSNQHYVDVFQPAATWGTHLNRRLHEYSTDWHLFAVFEYFLITRGKKMCSRRPSSWMLYKVRSPLKYHKWQTLFIP